ncbi:MAG: hypothetical protein AVDCRST_MAG64-2708, partial [uncultured Phycisphaerae bacterium]
WTFISPTCSVGSSRPRRPKRSKCASLKRRWTPSGRRETPSSNCSSRPPRSARRVTGPAGRRGSGGRWMSTR